MSNKLFFETKTTCKARPSDFVQLKKAFNKLNLNFYLINNVLLDAILFKDFITNDHKIELVVFEEEVLIKLSALLNELHTRGFKIITINPSTCFFQLNIKKNGAKFSFLGLKASRKKWRFNFNQRYPEHFFHNATSVEFLGDSYLTPNPPEEMLDYIYREWKATPKLSKPINLAINQVSMPKALKLLIFIRHIFLSFNLYYSYLIMGIKSKLNKNKREYLFSDIMLRKALTKNCNFIEIGSSDGTEMSNAITFTKGAIKGYLIEPSIENLEYSKIKIKRKINQYGSNVNFYNQAISGENTIINYYFSSRNPNLSTIITTKDYSEKRQVKSTTLKDFLLQNNISLTEHLVIKMDVEGAEVEILESSLAIFQKMKNVSILMEVHPTLYKDNRMKEILSLMISNGFKFTLVESAGLKNPSYFKDDNFMPFLTYNSRGLFKDFDEKKVIAACSKKIFNKINLKPFFTSKVIRSVLVEKQE
jgi:FkbM family methyltransferase